MMLNCTPKWKEVDKQKIWRNYCLHVHVHSACILLSRANGVWCDNGYSIISTIELLYDIMQYLHRFIYFTAAIFRFAIISYYSFLPPYIPYAFLIVTRLWLIVTLLFFIFV